MLFNEVKLHISGNKLRLNYAFLSIFESLLRMQKYPGNY